MVSSRCKIAGGVEKSIRDDGVAKSLPILSSKWLSQVNLQSDS